MPTILVFAYPTKAAVKLRVGGSFVGEARTSEEFKDLLETHRGEHLLIAKRMNSRTALEELEKAELENQDFYS